MKWPLLFLVHLYRLCISPLVGSVCRFTPTCSEYALQALQKHGAFYGTWLICKRLIKCQPWHSGGRDDIP